MKKFLGVVAVLLLLAVAAGGAWIFLTLNSPEYALAQMAQDVKRSGLDGLEPHLTQEAQETLDKLGAVSDNTLVGSILSALNADSYLDTLKDKLSEVEWSVDDVLRNSEKARVSLGFNYEDKITGTVEVDMVRRDGEWKISGIGMPDVEKLDW